MSVSELAQDHQSGPQMNKTTCLDPLCCILHSPKVTQRPDTRAGIFPPPLLNRWAGILSGSFSLLLWRHHWSSSGLRVSTKPFRSYLAPNFLLIKRILFKKRLVTVYKALPCVCLLLHVFDLKILKDRLTDIRSLLNFKTSEKLVFYWVVL